MQVRAKRWVGRGVLALGVVAIGGVVALGAVVANPERVVLSQVHVEVRSDGNAQVTEVIDYDFGPNSRHGIFRDVPGLLDAPVQASSDAPDDVEVTGNRIRVGNPDRTVRGRHRYRLTYELGSVAPAGVLRLNAVGTGWEVPITHTDIVVTGAYNWFGLRCDQGKAGDRGGCTARQVEPGRVVASIGDLKAKRGVSIYADGAQPLPAAPEAGAFAPEPTNDSPAVAVPAMTAAIAAAIAALLVAVAVQRAGREWVGAGGPADAAFGAGAGPRRIDAAKLRELSTIEFGPPKDVTAAEGGMVLVEAVTNDHKVAWLLDQAATGTIEVTQDDPGEKKSQARIVRTDGPERPLPPVLNDAFAGRSVIELGSYDKDFAKGWAELGKQLGEWRKASPLWDLAGDRRRLVALIGGGIALVLGAVGSFLAGFSGHVGFVPVPALVAGGALAAVAGAWELRIRTAAGSALWLRVESFRRFLADSEAQHVDWAAEHGRLRQYTAWAVALGEAKHWQKAVEASTVAPSVDPGAFAFAAMAHSLTQSTSSTSTAPSSGGGVGGGAGGGGGGSW